MNLSDDIISSPSSIVQRCLPLDVSHVAVSTSSEQELSSTDTVVPACQVKGCGLFMATFLVNGCV